jgi:hypothetical protein
VSQRDPRAMFQVQPLGRLRRATKSEQLQTWDWLSCGSSKRTGGLDFYEKYCKYFQYRIKARQRGLDGRDTF